MRVCPSVSFSNSRGILKSKQSLDAKCRGHTGENRGICALYPCIKESCYIISFPPNSHDEERQLASYREYSIAKYLGAQNSLTP